MKNILMLSLLALCLLNACKYEVDDLPLERPFPRDFYVQGEWRDTLPSTLYSAFDYTVGKEVKEPFNNQYYSRNISSASGGFKTIQCNLLGTANTNPLFFVRFSIPGTDSIWTESELKTLFIPDRNFPITGAANEPIVGFEIPWFVNTYWVSESWNAPHPSGFVKILSVEEYTWAAYNGFNKLQSHKGLKVKLQFQANLGRLLYRNFELRVVGEAEIRNGEASLFFEY